VQRPEKERLVLTASRESEQERLRVQVLERSEWELQQDHREREFRFRPIESLERRVTWSHETLVPLQV